MGLTQKQLTLLRKLVEISSSIPENDSIEFIVDQTLSGTSAMFVGTAHAPELENISKSDLNELRRSGHVVIVDYNGRGEEILQVSNETFAMFRNKDIAESELTTFKTGDPSLDELLDSAITKHRLHDLHERKNALEKLWDAWERLKTLEPGDKKTSTAALLDKAASEPKFRLLIENESRTLTDIGNEFRIRHHETGRTELFDPHQVDYFFERLLSLIRLLLRKSGRT